MAGIYIHIPFCARRCTYCDFYSTVGVAEPDSYIQALLVEAAMRAHELNGKTVQTVYVGGGTPSQPSSSQLAHLIQGLSKIIHLDDVEEFTVEVNPDDVNARYIQALREIGVNRISMGIQSFNDDELHAIGRRHDARQAIEAVNAIRQAGITNLSIDLIYGLPGQTLHSWQQSLAQALELRPEHISAYAFSYEQGTPLWQQRERGEIIETDEETSIAMYRLLIENLRQAGYEHYEISNFALPGYRSRHNSSYWNDTSYLGLGAAAHSYDCNFRRYNPASLTKYTKAIELHTLPCEIENITDDEKYDETVMVQLRTAQGINLNMISQRFGNDTMNHLMQQAQQFIEAGLLALDEQHLHLTQDGIMTSDNIIRHLMW
ncbi:MAG: radical SAM family heme chaperone HemW [Muribaculaceae bacterium]|nr:radical SAM family heme chaperone HemW [Muribaculaceae bacterium]